jgi:hypothetical protein
MDTVPVWPSSQVPPSPAARTTASVPRLPPAPALFSTIIP